MLDPTYDATAREVLALADVTPEQFCEIEATSERQRNFANDMKIKALSLTWEAIKESAKTPAMAKAVIQAIRDEKKARFWLDNDYVWSTPQSALSKLHKGIKKNMESQ